MRRHCLNPVVARLAMFLIPSSIMVERSMVKSFAQKINLWERVPGQRTIGKAGQLHCIGQSHHFL